MKKMAFTFLILSMLPGTVSANSCWIDQVSQRGDGLSVRFTFGSSVQIYVEKPDHSWTLYYHKQDKYFKSSQNETSVTEIPAIPMDIGDVTSLENFGHDTCTMHAVVQDGQIGLKAVGFFSLPGQSAKNWEEFFPAQ